MGTEFPHDAMDGLDHGGSDAFGDEIGDNLDGSFDARGNNGGASLADTLRGLGLPQDQINRLASQYIPKSAQQRVEGALRSELQELRGTVNQLAGAYQAVVQQRGTNGQTEQSEMSRLDAAIQRRLAGVDLQNPENRAKYQNLKQASEIILDAVKEEFGPKLNQLEIMQGMGEATRQWKEDWMPILEEVYGEGVRSMSNQLKEEWLRYSNQGLRIDPVSMFRMTKPEEASRLMLQKVRKDNRQRQQRSQQASMEAFSPMNGGYTGPPAFQRQVEDRPLTLMEKVTRAVSGIGGGPGIE